jgi:hypothetical protein
MNAADALKAARAAGVELALDGDDLALKAASAPPAAVIDALSQHKAEIVSLLRPGDDGWSAEDWQGLFDERVAIAEFDGRQTRANAEAQAFACCLIEWLNRNPAQSVPGRCLGCGDGNHHGDPLLPFGTETSGHAWLHGACWPAWHRERRGKAETALRALGARGPKHAEPVVLAKHEVVKHEAEILAALTKPNSDAAIASVEYGSDFETPCDARPGQVDERPDGLFLHFCEECGAWGAFGYGVSLRTGKLGRWYCAAHWPRAGVGSSMGLGLEQPDADGTDL